MKTSELSQQDQQQINGGSIESTPGMWPQREPHYSPEPGVPSGGVSDTPQPAGSDGTAGYDPGPDHPHYIK